MDFLGIDKIFFECAPSAFGRFRYKSENRKTPLEGEGGGPIQIRVPMEVMEKSQFVEVEATLVTRGSPPQPHWHELKGATKVRVDVTGLATFSDLSVIVNKNSESIQSKKEDNRVVRLYFEMRATLLNGESQVDFLISDPIFNSKLEIVDVSCSMGPAMGGNKMIILCTKARKQSTLVRINDYINPTGLSFGWQIDQRLSNSTYREMNGNELMFHQQSAIVVNVPPYHNQEITSPVRVYLTIIDKADQIQSKPIEYFYLPNETQAKEESIGRKKRKTQEEAVNFYQNYPKINSYGSRPTGNETSTDFFDFLGSEDTSSSFSMNSMSVTNNQTLSTLEIESILIPEKVEHSIISENVSVIESKQTPQIIVHNFEQTSSSLLNSSQETHPQNPRAPPTNQIQRKPSKSRKAEEDEKIIRYYASTGDVKFLLLSKQQSIQSSDKEGDTPLHHALIAQNQNQTFSSLCELSTMDTINSLNSDGETPLHVATWMRNLDALKKLHQMGANLAIKDAKGRTALHVAVENNFLEGVQLLLHVDKPETYLEEMRFDGMTPLLIAASKNLIEIAKKLVGYGANILKFEVSSGFTPLIYSVLNNSIEMINILSTTAPAPKDWIDQQDHAGNTALHHAVMKNKSAIAQKLVSLGASPEIFNNYLQNCYMLVEEMSEELDSRMYEQIFKGYRVFDLQSNKDKEVANDSSLPRYSMVFGPGKLEAKNARTSLEDLKDDEWVDCAPTSERQTNTTPIADLKNLVKKIPQLGIQFAGSRKSQAETREDVKETKAKVRAERRETIS